MMQSMGLGPTMSATAIANKAKARRSTNLCETLSMYVGRPRLPRVANIEEGGHDELGTKSALFRRAIVGLLSNAVLYLLSGQLVDQVAERRACYCAHQHLRD